METELHLGERDGRGLRHKEVARVYDAAEK
jgi:hypothetical protein